MGGIIVVFDFVCFFFMIFFREPVMKENVGNVILLVMMSGDARVERPVRIILLSVFIIFSD